MIISLEMMAQVDYNRVVYEANTHWRDAYFGGESIK
jgi:hypothetical protein